MVKKILALDIGGTSIRIAIVINNKILKLKRVPTPKTKKEFLKKLEELIQEKISKDIEGIGIGFPSPIENGTVKNAPNLPLNNFNLKKYLQGKFKKKVEISNDAGCVALAESKLGCKKKNIVVITLGTGIGGGMVVNGKPYRGSGFGAEFGHIIIDNKYWETSWQNTKKKYQNKFGKNSLLSDIVSKKDSFAKKILEENYDYMGQGIASIITTLDPEIVIVAGGVHECGKKFLNPIIKKVKDYSFLPRKTPIMWTKLEEPGILGASLLIN